MPALFGAGKLAREVGDGAAARRLLTECVQLGPEAGSPTTYALALAFLAIVLVTTGELEEARRLAEQSRERAEAAGECWTLIWATQALFEVCLRSGDRSGARGYADEALRLGRQIEVETIGLHMQALVDLVEGQYEQARVRILEMLALARQRDFAFLIGGTLHTLAVVALRQGNHRLAETLLQESVGHCRRIGIDISEGLTALGWVVLRHGGRTAQAAALLAEALPLSREREQHGTFLACLSGLARVATLTGEAARAARLVGATEAWRDGLPVLPAEAWRDALGVLPAETQRVELERTIEATRAALGEAAFAAARAVGAALPLDAAVAEALSVPVLIKTQADARSCCE